MIQRRGLVAVIVLVGLVCPGAFGQDMDVALVNPLSITLVETVHVVLGSALVTHATTIWDLFAPYFPADGADPFALFQVDIYAISDYEVTLNKETTVHLVPGGTTTASTDVVDRLMEIRTVSLAGDDDDSGHGDNPQLDWTATQDWTPFPDGETVFFHGGNTEGGAVTSHTAQEALRINLQALQNNASGNSYTFTITVTVTER